MQKDLSNYLSGGSLITVLASSYYFQQRTTELEQHLEETMKTVEGLREEMKALQKENSNMKATLGKYRYKSQKAEKRLENVAEFLEDEIGGFEEQPDSDDSDSDKDSESEEQSDSEDEERKPTKKKAKKKEKTRRKRN